MLKKEKIIHFLDHNPSFSNGLINFVKDLSFEQKKDDNEVLIISSADKYKKIKKRKWKEENVNILIERNLRKVINLIDEDDLIFFHVTSSLRYFTRKSKTLLDLLEKNAIFIFHVDPFYSELVGQRENMIKIIDFVNETNSLGISFSRESIKTFKDLGLEKIKKVQIGVNIERLIKNLSKKEDLKSFKNRKYFLTSSTGDGIYPYIKGVDRFVDLINLKKLNKNAINLGFSEYKTIKNLLLDREKSLNLMKKAKAFIQLSRSELYGIAVVEAKLTKTPVIVSDLGGLKDNVRYGFRVKNLEQASEVLDLIIQEDEKVFRVVEKNFKDSIKRENISKTWLEIKKIIKTF